MYCLNQSGKLKMPCISASAATACSCHVDQDTQELIRPTLQELAAKGLAAKILPLRITKTDFDKELSRQRPAVSKAISRLPYLISWLNEGALIKKC
ncbi:hypothetical protein MUK42_05007 [Musa troglodytarum]|uniref:Uncharacterized protein n=1 Tax=Musa troglodytarum TaxID=320322 RepID=A0A9E7GGN8_9LILI|nr:hypothetical protein MUK42_05007 [Musa troglodytarum]